MIVPIIFFSASNNTKYVAELIAMGLEAGGYRPLLVPVEACGSHAAEIEAAGAIGIGSPVYGGISEPVLSWMEGFDFSHKKVFIFSTAARLFFNSAGEAGAIVEKRGGRVIGAFEMRFTAPGDGIFLVERMADRYPLERAELERAFYFGKEMGEAIAADSAGQPLRDEPAMKIARLFVQYVLKKFALFFFKTAMFQFDSRRCIGCKKCVAGCPAGAIAMENGKPRRINNSKCICCFRCFKKCPSGALNLRFSRDLKYYVGPWQLKGYLDPRELARRLK